MNTDTTEPGIEQTPDAEPSAEQAPATEGDQETPDPQDSEGLMKALRSERELRKSERKRANEAEVERDSLAEKLSTAETERDKAKSKIAEITSARAHDLRVQVATDAGLDPKIAPRLTGKTREELEADARSIIAAVGGGGLDGGAQRPVPVGRTTEQKHSRTIGALLKGEDPNELDLWEED